MAKKIGGDYEIVMHYFKHPEMVREVCNVVFDEGGRVVGKNSFPGSSYSESDAKRYLSELTKIYGMEIFAVRKREVVSE